MKFNATNWIYRNERNVLQLETRLLPTLCCLARLCKVFEALEVSHFSRGKMKQAYLNSVNIFVLRGINGF